MSAPRIVVKRTAGERGGVPDQWERTTIATLLRRGGTIKTGPFGTLLKASEYSEDGVPVVSVGEIGIGFVQLKDGTPRVPPQVTKRLPEYRLNTGDIVFGRKGAVERSALIRGDQDGWFLGSDGIRLRLREGVIPEYLIYELQTQEVRNWLVSNAVGTTIASLNQEVLGRVPVLIAPDEEQRAIAAALSHADALIGALDNLIEKKRAIKLASMQQLLTGKIRLPGYTGPWEYHSIADLESQGRVRLYRGQVISKKDIEQHPGDYPIYSSSVLNNGLFGSYGRFMFDEELITWSVDGGGHFFYRPKHRFSVTNVSGYMRVQVSSINYAFLAAQLQLLHSMLRFDYQTKAHPSVIRGAYRVALPELREQQAVSVALSDMDAEVAALECRRDKAKAIKQGMMQELLTGRTRMV